MAFRFIESDIGCVDAASDKKKRMCENNTLCLDSRRTFHHSCVFVCVHLFGVLDFSPRGPRLGDLTVFIRLSEAVSTYVAGAAVLLVLLKLCCGGGVFFTSFSQDYINVSCQTWSVVDF